MDYFIVFFILIFSYQVVGETKIYEENGLWVFHVNDKTNISGNVSTRNSKSVDVNLSISYLSMTSNIHSNLEIFCKVASKVNKVVALLFPPKFKKIEFTLVGKYLAIPVLDSSSKNAQLRNNLKVKMYSSPIGSLPNVIEILQKWTSDAAVICNAETYEEIKHVTTYSTAGNIKSFQIASRLSLKKRTQMAANVLAKIRNLKITILVVYLDQDDLNKVLSLAGMMQMTGEEYRWLLSWESVINQMLLPSNALGLRPKNSDGLQNILSDSVDLVKKAFTSFTKKNKKDSVPFASCFNQVSPSFGKEFYKYIIQQSFIGKTGYVAFNKRGKRINAEYEVINLHNNHIVNISATTEPLFQSQIQKSQKLRAVTISSKPFVYLNKIVNNDPSCGTGLICHVHSSEDNNTEQYCCEGFIIELVQLLQTDLSVAIELHISKDGRYGSFNTTTNQWDGMVGELIRNEADVVIADLTITDDRSRVVDFTHPFMEIGVGVLVRVDLEGVTKGIWAFLQPVAAELWIATFLAISFMGILFWTMEKIRSFILDKFPLPKDDDEQEKRKTAKKFSFAASLHYSWSTVVRTRDKVTRPSNTSAKIGAISLALCFLVFITTYTAQLAAFLVAELQVTPITKGISDSKMQNPSKDLRIATIKGSSIESFLRSSADPNYVNIWQHAMGNSVANTLTGVEQLKRKEIDVLIDDYNTMVYIAAQDPQCSLRVIGEPFFKSGYSVALQKNSIWTSIFTEKLLQYEKSDTFLELAHRWMKTSCDGNKESVSFSTFHRMSGYDVSGMFVMLSAGVFISWLLLAAEFYYKKRQHKTELEH